MESTDQQILSLLARDGRMSFTDIGKATGLSTSAAQQRVRRLEQRGVITGYRAVVDAEALDRMLTAFVSLRVPNPGDDEDIPAKLAPIEGIVSCYSVAGRYSYLLKVQVESPKDLERLLQEVGQAASVSTETTLVLSVPYADRPLV
ncbi:Lrp/AsnC family transcriptional regulator [Propioniciclava soli]|uniref:Lrp/AsnC family transcriptional regulator n=1 Tax=Propioniciclava soli TaxID=2775081 RepID=UPI001E54F5E8|nr:Lrp/AsnC family transcriptional regulator [Propioniciclava soli]